MAAFIFLVLSLFSLCSVPAVAQQDLIAVINIIGNRRIPAETVRARMFTKPGDVYDQAALERDFNSLWNTGYFDDIRLEREQSAKGWIINVYVKEKPTIREIKYVGLSSVSQSFFISFSVASEIFRLNLSMASKEISAYIPRG